ncbi:MAG: hypothetical protein A3A80_03605 [Candidatus Terrybacteria bacterium RIFCSPLOWO2_01_FULL_44_24]|uniref:Uncharacterized protein n=1 Tax=Candidatus Terrybacteria bacterium RIFCSPHIGHO2_01_FULL_43_35 TaxID=1802361 RepID=A0A1G2PDN7_9BACT|nr:MAG: hypothetical protein A2828_00525 [Candidatus Terrybacteria bacterium RIFCSPHIGHO2_01_FULL_43_35]OHA49768.1 MAG: hypothetical protein A3B75_02100 [Candidatus Terrybacteria bacterium RIFCSPHIGHO2_02_FULL_43_14]OHA51590.1 MAG: hypothetical protein A3A80_03605 [Candidatus Terrybacteria bacterium RIFCSPLOWO2_01_FULL_44_24]
MSKLTKVVGSHDLINLLGAALLVILSSGMFFYVVQEQNTEAVLWQAGKYRSEAIHRHLQQLQKTQNLPPKNTSLETTFDYSEGNCTYDSQCTWAGEGCGGGHGMCTNQPEKYGDISTCDYNFNFPSNNGYTCGCISTLGKCGWRK